MSLVICPECKNEISQYAEQCPKCGFPLKEYLNKNKITDLSAAFVCPKCASIQAGWSDALPVYLKCRYCNTDVIQTIENANELYKLSIPKNKEEEYNQRCIEIAKQYGNNQFLQEEFESRINETKKAIKTIKQQYKQEKQQSSQIQLHCPTCNSTNIIKISASRKIAGAIGFGLFSKTAKSQFECKNCGYKF